MLRFNLSLLCAALVRGQEFMTTSIDQCQTCMETGVHCISEDFSETKCCNFDPNTEAEQLSNCMADFKYCSLNVANHDIKRLTCPSSNCSGKTKRFMIDQLDQNVTEVISWEAGEFDNCRLEFEANPDLPLALHVDVASLSNVGYDVYQMPRFFSKSRGYHGLFEIPNEYYGDRTNETFWIPSDYSLILIMRSQDAA